MGKYQDIAYAFTALAIFFFAMFGWCKHELDNKTSGPTDYKMWSKASIVLCILSLVVALIMVIQHKQQGGNKLTTQDSLSLISALIGILFGSYMMYGQYGAILPSGFIIVAIITVFQLASK